MADAVSILSGIAGIVGAVTGIISLVQVKKVKSLDLRMEQGRLRNAVQIGLDNLNDLADKANQSRIYRFSAQGISQSGAMQKWKTDFEKKKNDIQELSQKFSTLKNETVFGAALEKNILDLHLIEEQIKSITSDFSSSIAEDDVARDRLFRMKFQSQNAAAG